MGTSLVHPSEIGPLGNPQRERIPLGGINHWFHRETLRAPVPMKSRSRLKIQSPQKRRQIAGLVRTQIGHF